MAGGSDDRSTFDLVKEQLFNLRGKSRQDIRCTEEQVKSEDRIRRPYQHEDEKIGVTSTEAVENSYHSSNNTMETNISADEFDQTTKKELSSESGILVNHDTVVKDPVDVCVPNRPEAVPVENSYHGSSMNEERNASLIVNHNTVVKAPPDALVQNRPEAVAVENSCHDSSINEEQNIGLVTRDLSALNDRIRSLEADNLVLKQRLDERCASDEVIEQNVARLEEKGQRQNDRNSDEIISLQEQLQLFNDRIKKLEKENDKLKQSVRFPRTVDEWLGKNIENIVKTVLNEKLITYFSKALNVRYLGIIGSYLGFTDDDIYCHDSNGTSRESCRLLLKYWRNKMGETATIGCLLRSLYRVAQHEPACVDKHCLDDAINKASNSSLQ